MQTKTRLTIHIQMKIIFGNLNFQKQNINITNHRPEEVKIVEHIYSFLVKILNQILINILMFKIDICIKEILYLFYILRVNNKFIKNNFIHLT